jgi:hypothetical protein
MLQLFWISDNPYRNRKSEKFCPHLGTYFKKHMGLGKTGMIARGFSDCVEGSWRDLTTQENTNVLRWKETLDFSFLQKNKLLQ